MQHEKEVDVRQSQHSFVTTTSNTRDTMLLIRSIKHKNNTNSILKIVIAILTLEMAVLLTYIITRVIIIENQTVSQVDDTDNIYEPY